jgi:uncharacterized LabA/DUF88 family protein
LKTAILVDGGFYKQRVKTIYGDLSPEELANNLMEHCYKHLKHKGEKSELYRIFYYDCPPLDKKVMHPLTGETIDFKKTDAYINGTEFLDILRHKRKVALRLGKLTGSGSDFIMPAYNVRKLCKGKITPENLKANQLKLDVRQKGVDMRIGIDIASLAYKKQVDRIVLIAGDSDFVPAAKVARREGIDFILDPMWNQISQDLMEHIDGLYSKCDKPKALIKQEQEAEKKKQASKE